MSGDSWSPEQAQLEFLLGKCHQESNPERLVNHLNAVKTFLMVYLLQQSTLYHQIQDGQVVKGKLEDKIIKDCGKCVGETHDTMKLLHKFLRKYEDKGQDSMEFRVDSTRLLAKFDQSLVRFQAWFSEYHQKQLSAA